MYACHQDVVMYGYIRGNKYEFQRSVQFVSQISQCSSLPSFSSAWRYPCPCRWSDWIQNMCRALKCAQLAQCTVVPLQDIHCRSLCDWTLVAHLDPAYPRAYRHCWPSESALCMCMAILAHRHQEKCGWLIGSNIPVIIHNFHNSLISSRNFTPIRWLELI